MNMNMQEITTAAEVAAFPSWEKNMFAFCILHFAL
jgi:hypothetical protein